MEKEIEASVFKNIDEAQRGLRVLNTAVIEMSSLTSLLALCDDVITAMFWLKTTLNMEIARNSRENETPSC